MDRMQEDVAQDSLANTQVSADSLANMQLGDLKSRIFHPDDILGVMGVSARIIIIIILTWLLVRLIDKVTRRWTKRFIDLPEMDPGRQRALTVGTLLTSSSRYFLWPLAIIMVLSEVGLDISALIATAGIAGIALGFGAQTLVQDFISGVFLLFDDTIHVGDLVSVNGHDGVVEYIGIRLIKVRKLSGELLMVPAGEVRLFGNRSIDFMRVIVIIGLAYEQNLEETLPVLQRIADEWAEEHPEFLKDEAPLVQAITELGESSVNVRLLIKVVPGEQFEAERQIRRRIKNEFDRLGIEIPFPRRTVYLKNL